MIALKDVAKINPPPVKWTGSIVGNALITTGNSETENFGLSVSAVRRSEIDRITLGGAYYYGRQKEKDTDKDETTVDNWFVAGKYDYFLTKQLYLYGATRVEQDQIADLDLRLTIGGGVGYQWFETPTFNFNTEAGLAWVYEQFTNNGTDDHLAARLAYHLDWTPYKTRQALPQSGVAAEHHRLVRRLQPEHGRRPAGDDLRGLSSPRPRSSSATTRLRRPERRRKMYAISSASAGRSDRMSARAIGRKLDEDVDRGARPWPRW